MTERVSLISNIDKKIAQLPESKWILLLTLLGALIAWRVIYIQHGWINDDSVLYFEVARLFAAGDVKAGLSLYNWALYPALIAGLHLSTGFTLQLSAQLLNGVFFAITSYSFFALIHISGGTKRTLLCGAALLFSTTYIVGDVLPMLLRDEGFWAFFLSSIYCFIQYYRHQTLKFAILWQVFAIIAVLFRVEAFTFFAVLPFIFILHKKPASYKSWMYAHAFGLIGLVLVTLAIFIHPNLNLADFGRLSEVVTVFERGYINITQGFSAKANIISQQVMGDFLDEYSMLVLLIGLITILAHKCLLSAGWIAFGLIVTQFKHLKTIVANDALTIFYWVIGITVINAAFILTNVFLLSGRYMASLGFILLILAAFCFEHLFKQAKKRIDHIILTAILMTLAFSFLSNILPIKTGYNYEKEAVIWAKQHSSNPEAIFYVSPRARFYADAKYQGRGYDYWDFIQKAVQDGTINRYDLLVLNLDRANQTPQKEALLSKQLANYQLVHTVYGYKKKKKILIYKKLNEKKLSAVSP